MLILDIERTYGGAKKPLASRVPLSFGEGSQMKEELPVEAASTTIVEEIEASTPGATEGQSVPSGC
jgi:phosphatidylethanolamine N-methyltransferase